ncbi:MAG: trypsin-like peptidase domain-containing protein [Planctomycetota bacterium]|nr:trypsin-like peptidase domain-containing protein [Planctomycetota bacterium]MDA1177887.1 trypsin-like peptidase domain-containing protein [Planctomycetota bacterium]
MQQVVRRRAVNWWFVIGFMVLLTAVGLLWKQTTTSRTNVVDATTRQENLRTLSDGQSIALDASGKAFAEMSRTCELIAQRVQQSVVHITSEDAELLNRESPQLREVWGLPEETRLMGGLGSGTVVRRDGCILTNEHVIRGMNRLQVILSDGSSHTARRVAEDPGLDLALIRIDRVLPALDWGDSTILQPGSWVLGAGSPYRGLDGSLSWGIVSGLRHNLGAGPYQELLQTNSVTHPGFSGGPLVDRNGQLVGIHVAIVGTATHGLSLALPSARIREAVQRMLGPDPQ